MRPTDPGPEVPTQLHFLSYKAIYRNNICLKLSIYKYNHGNILSCSYFWNIIFTCKYLDIIIYTFFKSFKGLYIYIQLIKKGFKFINWEKPEYIKKYLSILNYSITFSLVQVLLFQLK